MVSHAVRQSNFELLRIVATLFILVVHFNGWFINDLGGGSVINWKSGGYTHCLWRIVIQSITCIGVDLFILISGYFAIRPKVKSIVNLFTLLAFFYVACYCLDCTTGPQAFTPRGLVRNIFAFSRENWFIQCYLFLMLLAPMVNQFMDSLTEKQAGLYVMLFISLAFYFGCICISRYFYFNEGYSVTSLLLIYIVGRYIRLFGEKRISGISSRWLLALYAFSTIIICAIIYFVGEEERWINYSSPIVIISSSLLFLLFARIDIKSDFVNWVGKSCLAAFIVHTTTPIIGWLSNIDTRLFLNQPLCLWIINNAFIIIAVFSAAIILDQVRLLISRPIIHVGERIDLWISNYVK